MFGTYAELKTVPEGPEVDSGAVLLYLNASHFTGRLLQALGGPARGRGWNPSLASPSQVLLEPVRN